MTDSILSCKFIFTDTNGYCIANSELKPDKDAKSETPIYKIEKLDIRIDLINYEIFRNTKYKFFYALKDDQGLYHLKPIKNQEVSEFRKRNTDIKPYENPEALAKGAYGKVDFYPTENIVMKKITSGIVETDFVKEIGVYRLFKEFACLPHFNGFLFTPGPKIMLEKGLVTIDKLPMTFEVSKSVSFQIVKCLKLFNSQGLIHLDLKPDNVVVSNISKDDEKEPDKVTSAFVQIIDWGICEIDHCSEAYQNYDINKQTLWWRSPEVLAGINYNYKADIFSLGILFLEFYIYSVLRYKNPGAEYKILFPASYEGDYSIILQEQLLGIKMRKFHIGNVINFDYPLHNIIKVIILLNYGESYFKVKNQLDFDFDLFENALPSIIVNKKINILNQLNQLTENKFSNLFTWPEADEKLFLSPDAKKKPFLGYNPEEQNNFLDLISHMLEFNPKFRYSYDDIMLHPYFQNIKRQSHPPFPIFLNNMKKINLVDVYTSEEKTNMLMARRNQLIHSLIEKKYTNEAKFLTIQLFDIFANKHRKPVAPEKFDLRFDLCEYIAQCMYPMQGNNDFVMTAKFKEYRKNDNYGQYNTYVSQILDSLDGNVLIPSLYSYYIYYKKEIPDQYVVYQMFNFYKDFNCYMNDFKDVIEKF